MTRNDVAIRLVDAMHESLLAAYRALDYADYLLTDHWLSVRQAALKRSGGQCQLCRSQTRLEVHHNTYDNFGNEQAEDLIVLCHDCHAKHHDKQPPAALAESGRQSEEIRLDDQTVSAIRLRVIEVEYVENYVLRFGFDQASSKSWDFASIIQTRLLKSVANMEVFKRPCVNRFGQVCWPNGSRLPCDFFLDNGEIVVFWREDEYERPRRKP